ncbi:histidine kinase [Pseudofrankia sp. BMG5.36]|uniref:sensor histidine kinase n=1 Tax=Pseudofrankia sp. BMG5.36 TaxID=1834512 RepID=UPI000B2586D2|nr:histidine kinase [Pseudofrankia sp. BMG5.36]
MNSGSTAAAGRGLRAGRGVVYVAAGVLLVGFVAGLAMWAARAAELPDQPLAVLADVGVPLGWYVGYYMALELLLVTTSLVAAYYILRGVLSWFRLYLVFVLVLFATAGGAVPGVIGQLFPSVADAAALVQGVAWIALFPLGYVFPDGRPVPGRSRWLVLGWAGWLGYVTAADSAGDGPVESGVLLLLFGSCVAAQVYRYARVSDLVARMQTRWVMYAVALRLAYSIVTVATPIGRMQDEVSPRGLAVRAVTMLVSYLIAAALPAAIAIAVVRHRLFDIDAVISRTLVYGVLTAFVVGVYTLVVSGLGALWRGGTALPLLATGLVAVAFSPLREQAQSRVSRLVYGDRGDPYGVLSLLGRQLAGAVAPEAVAPTIVAAVARTLKAPFVAIDQTEIGASIGREVPDIQTFPLVYQGEALGRLVVGGERLSAADRRLLADLADHCGAAVYAARESAHTRQLAVVLQRTREELVTAREEERRRLRRDLHDSLGPALGGQSLTIDAARAALTTDPATADRLLRDLRDHTQETLAEVRRLARQLRPPVLDELGLAGALTGIQDRYERPGLQLSVDVTGLPELPAAVEVAVYRIAQEALTNVIRHADAGACRLRVTTGEGELVLEVADNGRGIGSDAAAGVGILSMRERAEELGGTLLIEIPDGGGTRIRATFPLRRPEVE